MRFLLLLIVVTIPVNRCRAAEPTAWDAKSLDTIVEAARNSWNVPGVAVVLVHGKNESVRGYGVKTLGNAAPVTPDTVFPLASCTKAFTTTLLAMVADEGKLSFDDPVRKHFAEFHLSDPHVDALVTLRDLVSHRTGVRGHDLLWYRAPWDEAELFRRMAKLPVDRPFRSSFEYSTLMFLAAGKALTNRAEQPWHDLVRSRITEPLGMTRTTFSTKDAAFLAADRASGHREQKDGRIRVETWYEVPTPNPAGSINLPASDLVPWLRFQLANGTHAGKRLVSEAQLTITKSPQTIMPMEGGLKRLNPETVQMSYAMGWIAYDYRGRKVVAHGGMIDGFRIQITLLPDENLGIALLNNLHDTKMNTALTNSLIDKILGLPTIDWNAKLLNVVREDATQNATEVNARNRARRADIAPTLELDRYVGTYEDPAYGTATIARDKNGLRFEWSTFRTPLEPWQGDTFRTTESFLEDQLVEFRIGKTTPDALRVLGTIFKRAK